MPAGCVVVQSDRTLLVEVDHPGYPAARDALARFAEMVKSPEHVHTYRITPLSLWNAATAGWGADRVLSSLREHSRFDVPQNVIADVTEYIGRYGRLTLLPGEGDAAVLEVDTERFATRLARDRVLDRYLQDRVDDTHFRIRLEMRGALKLALINVGYPVVDKAGFTPGVPLAMELRTTTRAGLPFALRAYQQNALHSFLAGADGGGTGVVVLPCGAGKTVVAMAAMAALKTETLILATSTTAVHQWMEEIKDKMEVPEECVVEYTGRKKNVGPVTVATYSVLTTRKGESWPHFNTLSGRGYGLIIYDEVHLLPAPVFRVTAEIQGRRRLGLTATLVREDGREGHVFGLIGPKRYDSPWRELEAQGFIAQAICTEMRVPFAPSWREAYEIAGKRGQHRVAAENPVKLQVVRELVEAHASDLVLIIGQYLHSLREVARELGAPLITGETPEPERDRLFGRFKRGEERILVASKVANFAIDLPDANVLIQLSGAFGSRQEEAQRLGRILRPKGGPARFYTLVTRESVEMEMGMHRQLFLAEQGYKYAIEDWAPPDGVPLRDAPPPPLAVPAPGDERQDGDAHDLPRGPHEDVVEEAVGARAPPEPDRSATIIPFPVARR
ncbi:MAG: helicase-associated domain-containing protein [Deltaproteobacteria bacterium]|nr:helicase-associated domain-containing protein [Deltaproteobacteria bacterium]